MVRSQIQQVVEAEDEELKTHFVDNPFIRKKTAALSAKIHLGGEGLEAEEDKQEIYISKETGKFVIRDFEDTTSEDEMSGGKKLI